MGCTDTGMTTKHCSKCRVYMSFQIQDTEHKEHAVVKCKQSRVFSSLHPTPPLLIAFVHLYAAHHHFRQRSSGGLDCLVFVGVVKYIVMPAVFLMFMQRQHQTKQRNPCKACAVAEFSLSAVLPSLPVAAPMLISTLPYFIPLRAYVPQQRTQLHPIYIQPPPPCSTLNVAKCFQ